MAIQPVDLSTFTDEQKKAFNVANALGSGVPVISSETMSGSSSPTQFQTYTPPPIDTSATTPMEMTEPEKEAQGEFDALRTVQQELLGESAFRTEQENAQDVAGKKQAVTDLSSRLKTLQNEALALPLQLQQESIGRGRTAGGLQPLESAALRNNAIQALSVNSLLEASRGNLTTALDLADRAVKQKYDPIKEKIAVTKANLELIMQSPAYSLAEKNRAQKQLDIQRERERGVAKDELDSKEIYNMALTALQNGADQTLVQQIQRATSPQDAMNLAGRFLQSPEAKLKLESAKLDLQLRELELARARAGVPSKAPEVKTINGVDMQWNSDTNSWEPVTVGGAGTMAGTQKSLDQLSFLRAQVKNALPIVGNAGSPTTARWISETILGQSKFKQLEQYVDTLRVNVLALMTDPTIKKFFGPQMSNADVLLMTSAGTTLNADRNSPQQLTTELGRLEDLFNRMETSVRLGSDVGGTQNIITAPDGRLIQIID